MDCFVKLIIIFHLSVLCYWCFKYVVYSKQENNLCFFNVKSYVASHLSLLLIHYNSYKSYLYFEKMFTFQIKQNQNLRNWKKKCKFYQQEIVFCPHGETQLKSYEIAQNMIYTLTDKSWFQETTHSHYQK